MDISNLVIQEDIKLLKQDIKQLDKKLDKIMNIVVGFAGNVDELRTENIVGTHQTKDLQDKVDNHEKRLHKLETSKM